MISPADYLGNKTHPVHWSLLLNPAKPCAQEKEHKNRLLEHRLAQLEAREQSTTAFHTTLVQK